MASDGAALAAAAGPPIFTNVIFHHVPNALAPTLLAALVVTSVSFGAIALDLISNFAYDVRMIRQPGWLEPRKAGNRVAYFVARIGSLVYLAIAVIYLTVPGLKCAPFAQALGAVWIVVMLAADGLYVQRVAAVYAWHPSVAVPLVVYYLAYATVCAASVHDYGFGIQIPMSDFCAFVLKPRSSLFTACIIMGALQDVIVLVLVTHRLTDGGLLNIFHLLRTPKATLAQHRAERKALGEAVGEVSISALLLKQGVGFFVVLVTARFAFMSVYYVSGHDATIQLLVSSLVACIAPILAGAMFRQVYGRIRRRSVSGSWQDCQCTSNSSGHRSFSTMHLPTAIRSLVPDRRLRATTRTDDVSSSGKSPKLVTDEKLTQHVPAIDYNAPAMLADGDGHLGLQICVEETVDVEACTMQGPVGR